MRLLFSGNVQGVCILAQSTLADKVARNFSKVKLKKVSVKVPKLKNTEKQDTKKPAKPIFLSNIKDEKMPASSIVDALIKTAFEEVKNTKKTANPVFPPEEEDKGYTVLKDGKDKNIGGYGTVSKVYGITPNTSYVDYARLFSHLGKFRAKSAYEDMAEHVEALNNAAESGSFVLADRETMEKGKFYVRYTNSKIPIDKTSLVPIAEMNSAEWEQFKWFMRLDTALYLLKISTS